MDGAALICLPYAGSGASFFRSWRAVAPKGLRIVPVQLPGREERFAEPLLTTVEAAMDDLVPRLLPDCRAADSVALFGHSLGAVLAYELAHRLGDEGGVTLSRLFVSGSPGPSTVREIRASKLDDDQFVAQVNELAGYSHPALDHPELRELLLPVLRADVEMHENYRPPERGPLEVPISALRGRDDLLVSAGQAGEWREATTADTSVLELDGGHMYLTDHAHALLRLIATLLDGPDPR
ncbi:thioesterase II family protein [Rhodococcus daqingensis]|uniref:Thioesterase TesA n=1 Tax=Rhodococcus daqingensis TaxID=2479363 RepID=A0ABW2RZK3_9NOCA